MKTWGALTAFVCAAAMAVPAPAVAEPGYGVSMPYRSFSATLPRSNGYKVYLRTFRNSVEVEFYRRGQLAIYLAKGKVTRNEIAADFGRFGRIHVHFSYRLKKREHLFPGCKGRQPIKARGRLDGKMNFHGERNFATISSERTQTSYEEGFKEVCYYGPDRNNGHNELIEALEAIGRTTGNQWVILRAVNWEGIGHPVITASTWDRVGPVIAFKTSSTFEEGSLLEFSPPEGRPQSVSMRPTVPFRGGASLAVQPDGPAEWTGDLRVPFPGLGVVTLTGDGFHAYACRYRLSEQGRSCRERDRARAATAAAPTPSPWRWRGFPR
ncbi:MAG TPA: hypothetical protein VLK37_00120 [Solirubrobacterales bacterium]|nr:hypothetical protein [Solirubrobacterales bacterium]